MGIYLYYYCQECNKRSDQMELGEDVIGNYLGGMVFLCRHALHGVGLIDDIADEPIAEIELDVDPKILDKPRRLA